MWDVDPFHYRLCRPKSNSRSNGFAVIPCFTYYMISCYVRSGQVISYIISYHVISYHISYHISYITCHIICHKSCHVISYHIIYHIIKGENRRNIALCDTEIKYVSILRCRFPADMINDCANRQGNLDSVMNFMRYNFIFHLCTLCVTDMMYPEAFILMLFIFMSNPLLLLQMHPNYQAVTPTTALHIWNFHFNQCLKVHSDIRGFYATHVILCNEMLLVLI